MDYDEYITIVHKAVGESREAAERATRATLGAMGERLGADESLQLVSQLPPELGPLLYTAGGSRSFDAERFIRRVAEREQVDAATAERHAEAVLIALARAVSDDEYAHLVSRLSRDYASLLPKGRNVGTVSYHAFLASVAVGAGVDVAEARRISEACLETLAERVAAGDVDDLMSRLPVRLHAVLKRGRASADAATRTMSAEDFVHRVAQRAGVPAEQAAEDIRAVLATVRKTVTEEEFLDVAVQLPGEYRLLLERA
jgi:uncharacterized protein (DUF2267 family)